MTSPIPTEFSEKAIVATSDSAATPYRDFVHSREPYQSLYEANPNMRPPKTGERLLWGEGKYYDTTVARKHTYWKDLSLPKPEKDIAQLRQDFHEWGYCLVEDGLSVEQNQLVYQRVMDQAEAERELGIAYLSEAQQHVWSLVNKGDVFNRCMTHDTDAIQAGLLIELLLDEMLGSGWHHLSYIANISFPGCHPQGMHQDQGLVGAYKFLDAPVLVNTVYVLQDVDEVNGGTLVIPGSHRRYIEGNGTFGKLPPPINLEAPAGTVMLMDGRVLHGGAVNRSDDLRYIITNSVVRPFIRQQESFHLTIRPEILANASEKFLWRCGFQANAQRSMVEGFGYYGTGRPGDESSAIVNARIAMDAGEYQRVGELSPGVPPNETPTLKAIQQQHETQRAFADKLTRRIESEQ
ncbi:MAG: phytanoyl-CoA dioxygenase family protein [Pseudomonadales bacterium]|nr:phytanoyl-CoA dioxygenase family protein [Pseudomonadales bacterium]MDG1303047.1 phytanoyl-CoA dioxygenase family protein [Pseudomonadales bacterium]MDG1910725.1 phytanoyl-CoA dioxygenase family protein [Pseudomonadales bacterium]